MKLINCPACSKEISPEAVSCPACGQPFRAEQNRQARENHAGLVIIVVVLIVVAILMLIGAAPSLTVLLTNYH